MSRAQFAPLSSADVERAERAEVQQPVRRTATPLVVGAADDRAEVEADRVADAVIARLQGGESAEGGGTHVHDDCHGVARSAAPAPAGAEVGFEGGAISDETSARIEARRGTGSALDGGVRQRMESGFGRSLGDVRIHTDSEAADLNRSVSARAFTTGKDIFFGQGEYQPGTAQGEQVLAHELAHTQQGGGGVGRLHRWDIDKKLDWTKTKKIGTVSSGQAVFFLDDGANRIAVKSENAPIGLAQMSTVLQESLAKVKSVKHVKLSDDDRAVLTTMITSEASPLRDQKSWAKLGAEKRSVGWVVTDLEKKNNLQPGTGIAGIPDEEVGRFFHEQYLAAIRSQPFMAMSAAEGIRAQEAGTAKDVNPMQPQETRMRGLMTDWRHLVNLGQLTAVDLFMNNHDRVFMGNVGNWFYDPYSAAITTIDHVDANVPQAFRGLEKDSVMEQSLSYLAKANLGKTAKQALVGLTNGVEKEDKGNDAGFGAWMRADGGYRVQAAEEALEQGLLEGRKLIVKTFSATRFSLGKSGKEARATKKAIKQAARAGQAVDDEGSGTDPDMYYKILKARAEWVKKH